METYNDIQKETINTLIKKLEKIRDTGEIEQVDIKPIQEVDNWEMCDGTCYVTLSTIVEIRHRGVYEKGDIFDDFLYKPIQ